MTAFARQSQSDFIFAEEAARSDLESSTDQSGHRPPVADGPGGGDVAAIVAAMSPWADGAGGERDERFFADGDIDVGGAWGRAGVFSGEFENGFGGEALTAEGKSGRWEDETGTNYGLDLGARLAGFGYQGDWFAADVNTIAPSVERRFNPDTGFSYGGGFSIMDGSATLGDEDNSLRLGVGSGEGAGIRGHWADADGDGLREIGSGIDAGPISFDIKTELPHRLWNEGSELVSDALGDDVSVSETAARIRADITGEEPRAEGLFDEFHEARDRLADD